MISFHVENHSPVSVNLLWSMPYSANLLLSVDIFHITSSLTLIGCVRKCLVGTKQECPTSTQRSPYWTEATSYCTIHKGSPMATATISLPSRNSSRIVIISRPGRSSTQYGIDFSSCPWRQAHAFRLCLQVPAYGGSLIQKSDEEILKFADSRGQCAVFTSTESLTQYIAVPIIIVFTQLDKLVSRKRQQAKRAKLNVEITPEGVVEEFHEQYRTQLEVVQAYKCVHVSGNANVACFVIAIAQLFIQSSRITKNLKSSWCSWRKRRWVLIKGPMPPVQQGRPVQR